MATTSSPTSPSKPGVLVGDAAAAAAAVSTSNYVYVRSEAHGWIPARLLEVRDSDHTAIVSVPHYKDEESIVCDGGRSSKKSHKLTVKLAEYPHGLLLQNVDERGLLKPVADMVDLPFLHEAAILYNLKSRHIQKKPYTRTGDIVIACNPYQWYHHLYNEELRHHYALALIWDTDRHGGDHGDPRSHLEPHVYESSSLAYRGLAVEGDDQSILVSGESGAGKTETVKILLHDLASVQRGLQRGGDGGTNSSSFQSEIVQRVLDSNPLLEAFGNAKTVRNDNSSRFGKFLQLQFDTEDPLDAAILGKSVPSCILAGSKCQVYLLEKSRVVRHEADERTYHIFYQLLAAENEVKTKFWDGLEDTDHESFLYVGYTDTDVIEGVSDADRFQLTLDALALVGITDDKLISLMRAICVVLQLGNLLFGASDTKDGHSVVENEEDLQALADLMGIPAPDLLAALTIRTVRARNEEFKVPLNAIQAKDSTDAFAKEIYAKTFLWLVRNINDATCAEKNYECRSPTRRQQPKKKRPSGESYGLIGMLDIFGFESFGTNRFEQLCINYANEKLQQKFTQDIFRSVQAEYEFEGIELGEITYDDNTDVLDLVEGRMGLLAFLNEECVRPGGSDKGFVLKARAMNKESPCFKTEAAYTDFQFGVHHYAGLVVYDATHFVTKNMDTLPTDLQECATKSTNDIIANELTNESDMNAPDPSSPSGGDSPNNGTATKKKSPPKRAPKRPPTARGTSGAGLPTPSGAPSSLANKADTPNKNRGSNLIGVTVWTKFKNQLSDLMEKLQQTRTRYIRCIKPNVHKLPLVMQHGTTIEQLRCAGVVAAVTISRSAFPNRLEHASVLDRFKALWRKGDHVFLLKRLESGVSDPLDDNADDEEGEQEQRLRNAVDTLLTWALKCLEVEMLGTTVKAYVMGKTRAYFRAGALEYLENERVKALSVWAVEMQKIVRRFLRRSRYTKMRFAALRTQAQHRMRRNRASYRNLRASSIRVENWYRCKRAAQTLIVLRRHHMATLIQTHYRMGVATANLKSKRAASIVVQAMVRGALQRPKFRLALHEKREEAKLENQVRALQKKLEEAEARRIEAERQAEERARRAVEQFQRREEEEKKDTPASSVASASERRTKGETAATGSPDKEGGAASAAASFHTPVSSPKEDPGLSAQQQQTLMDESGKMLEYLRKEVYKLRSHNVQLRTDCDLLKDNNQRLMDANASAGASFQALNQHTKQLSKANEKLKAELSQSKQLIQKLNITQVELKEELKMKQATYVAEVHSRLQYSKALGSVVDLVQERSRDSRLVEDVLSITDACEAEYQSGPTGLNGGGSRLFGAGGASPSKPSGHDSGSGLMSSIRSLWS